jgi:hypothetical protein
MHHCDNTVIVRPREHESPEAGGPGHSRVTECWWPSRALYAKHSPATLRSAAGLPTLIDPCPGPVITPITK